MAKKFKRFFNSAIRFFEFSIAVITLLVLLALIVFEVMKFSRWIPISLPPTSTLKICSRYS